MNQMGTADFDSLLRNLHRPIGFYDPGRINTIRDLGDLGDARAVVPLCEILIDPDEEPMERSEAARSLGRIGDERALKYLLKILIDPTCRWQGFENNLFSVDEVSTALSLICDAPDKAGLISELRGYSHSAAKELSQMSNPRIKALVALLPKSIFEPIKVELPKMNYEKAITILRESHMLMRGEEVYVIGVATTEFVTISAVYEDKYIYIETTYRVYDSGKIEKTDEYSSIAGKESPF